MVAVGGYAMHVWTAGLDTRAPGAPAVVFENGATAPLEAWGEVPAQVAAFAPVVAYDRSTLGRSVWDGEEGTPAHVTARLWALLQTLGVEPPYVLVGWSWGGDLIRHHAGTHPSDVVGLVHVDPAGHSPSAALSVLRAIGAGEEAYAADVAGMEGALPTIPPNLRADVKPINRIYAGREEPDYGSVPPVPTAVLLAGRRRPPSAAEREAFGAPPYDFQAHAEARLRDKIGRLSEWVLAAPDGLFMVVRNSGHALQREAPELVVDAIRRVVFPDVTPRLRAAVERGGASELARTYALLKQRYPPERFTEGVLNGLGYTLLGEGRVAAAVAVFELNVRTYPASWNVHDSLGDGYAAAGQTEQAIASYRRALGLNPNSPSAGKLEALQGQ